jgi:hypothetical protein
MKTETDILVKISELELEISQLKNNKKHISKSITAIVILDSKIEMLKWILNDI